MVKTYNNLYEKVCDYNNLVLAWKKARKGKTRKPYVLEFQENLINSLDDLQKELINETYSPRPLKTFILRDPKTRKISKAHFRDRIVHHAIINLLEPIYEKIFIYDCCANRKGKGTLFALKRFHLCFKKVSNNGELSSKKLNNNFVKGYCLKADIRHYFMEINHEILLKILDEKIKDEKFINLIKKILVNGEINNGIGMPLGNLTSQFLANVYLNKLDYFAKHTLKAKYYIRYVDDFILFHKNKIQLEIWKIRINNFLKQDLKLELHQDKSKVKPLSKGIDFVGFRNFFYFKLLRKRNYKKIISKIKKYEKDWISHNQLMESFQGWNAHAKWANCYKIRKRVASMIYQAKCKRKLINN
ncbi:MAG: reverse transcriptase/maturase family protein [Candidatus Pacearchaeota archaeon]